MKLEDYLTQDESEYSKQLNAFKKKAVDYCLDNKIECKNLKFFIGWENAKQTYLIAQVRARVQFDIRNNGIENRNYLVLFMHEKIKQWKII